MWSRSGELIGSGLPLASTLVELSSRVKLPPPLVDRRMPTPCTALPLGAVVAWPSPVPAKMIDWLGSLFLGKTAMLPMLIE